MEITCVERNLTYFLEGDNEAVHEYTISTNRPENGGESEPFTHIEAAGSEIDIPTAELPFLIEALRLFLSDDKKINE